MLKFLFKSSLSPSLTRRVQDWMIGVTAPYIFTWFGTTDNYSAVPILHTLQFIVAQALRFSVFTSRIQATDL
jgi:hypothetical protein